MGRDDDEEERADLAARVKQLQRENEDGKQQWWSFCDAEGFSNRRDPNRHTADFLRRFFDARRDGRIPQGSSPAAPPHEADPEMHKIWVGRIKQAQRSSPEQKAKWEKYCDVHGGGVRDPQRHDSNYLRRFIEEYVNEDAGGGAGAGAGAAAGWPAGAPPMPGYPPMGAFPPMGGYPMPGMPGFPGYPPMGYPPMPGFPPAGAVPSAAPGMGGPEAAGYPPMPGYPGMPGYPPMPNPMMGGAPANGYPWMMGGAPGAAPPANPYVQGPTAAANGGRQQRSRSRRRKKRDDRSDSI